MMATLGIAARFPESSEMFKQTKNLAKYFERHSQRDSFKGTVPPPPPAKN
jgi:hypothetical protein